MVETVWLVLLDLLVLRADLCKPVLRVRLRLAVPLARPLAHKPRA